MVLFDTLIQFTDYLQGALIVLVIKEVFWGLLGGNNSSQGGGNSAGNLFKKLFKDDDERAKEVGALRNIASQEVNIDMMHNRLNKLDFAETKKFEDNLAQALQFMNEVIALEQEADRLYTESKSGQAPPGVADKIKQIRAKYVNLIEKVYHLVAHSIVALKTEKQALVKDANLFVVEEQRDNQLIALLNRVWALTGRDGKMIETHKVNQALDARQEADLRKFHQMAIEIERLMGIRRKIDAQELNRVKNLNADLDKESNEARTVCHQIERIMQEKKFVRMDQLIDITKWLKQLESFAKMDQYKVQGVGQQEMVELRGFDTKVRLFTAQMASMESLEKHLLQQDMVAKKKMGEDIMESWYKKP
jgi:hypothetical protein